MSLPTENLDEATPAEHADHHFALHTLANDVVNVRSPEYGAKGDNVTNDTDAVLAAQAVAYAGRKPLWFPAGTYILDHSTFVLQGEEVWV
ncbi:MAG: hypothetical protein GY698_18625, partial [Actinomycetia bacterium]|nr:hypothetical protein [Actinomycetes bacterium]